MLVKELIRELEKLDHNKTIAIEGSNDIAEYTRNIECVVKYKSKDYYAGVKSDYVIKQHRLI